MSKIEDAANRTLTIERVFKATLTLVWDAWTQPHHIAQWWGPQGMETTVEEHDFRVGGRWRFSMKMPDGNLFIGEGVYQEIIEHQKIVFTADFKPMTEGVEIHVLFSEDGDQTKFTFHCIHNTEEYCRQQEEMGFYNGWGSTFDRLTSYLEK